MSMLIHKEITEPVSIIQKKKNVWLYLPKKIKEDIDAISFASNKHKNKALKFIGYILKESRKDNYDSLKFREVPTAYFRKVYKTRYKKEFLDLLIKNNIIQVNNHYSTDRRFSKSYRLNSSYFIGDIDLCSTSYTDLSHIHDDYIVLHNTFIHLYVPYMLHRFEDISLKDARINFSRSKKAIELGIRFYPFFRSATSDGQFINSEYVTKLDKQVINKLIDSLTIDYERINKKIREIIESVSYQDFQIDGEIKTEVFKVSNRVNNNTYRVSLQKALEQTRSSGFTLIQDKKKYYIDDLDRYIETKKTNIHLSYSATAMALKKKIYHLHRNPTNLRLDSVFTSMSTHLIKIIKEDNDLVEIDLVNSQYTIFANWLMTQKIYANRDVKDFCRLCINGGLYEYIAEELHLVNRSKAKELMMIIAFSSYRFHSDEKDQFKNLFPNVFQFIYDYNKENKGSFAVCLQNRESRIFIDGLMNLLISKTYFVLTKHDSLIVRREELDDIIKMVLDYFEVINFHASIKCEGKVYSTA